MDLKSFFKKHGIHFIAIGLFFIVAIAYFSPQFNGYGLKQHDIEQFKGMSNEIKHFRETNGEEPLWTNSMFGGMPATQISVLYGGNIGKMISKTVLNWFSMPAGAVIWHLICFYILALCLRIKPIIGILGAFAFAFASYEIVILQAGHNSKALAVAFTPAVLGAFILAFRRNWKWGAILSALFMTLELAQNHFQVTYYLGILLFFLGVFFAIEAVVKKTFKQFGFATVGVLVGYGLALFINYGNIAMTNDYAKHTIRGGNDVTINTDGSPSKIATSGLDKEYITNWSYGLDESFTLVSPYVVGSHNSAAIADTRFAELADNMELSRGQQEQILSNRAYWGEQPITSGPVYLGVIVIFLSLLGLFFLKDNVRWVLFGVSVLALVLSWGKNFMGFTEFFIDYIPGYNKFRTVTIILVLVELCMPVIAIMLLQKFYEQREALKEQSKKFMIVAGGFLVFLIGLKAVGVDNTYASQRELDYYNEASMYDQFKQQLAGMDPKTLMEQYRVDANNPQQMDAFINAQIDPAMESFESIKAFRKEIFSKSTTHSLIVGVLGIAIVALFFFTSLPSMAIIAGLGIVTVADLLIVDGNYLGKDEGRTSEYLHWVEDAQRVYPIAPNMADNAILTAESEANPSLAKLIAEGEKKGKAKADELEYSGADRRRVIEDYKFAALRANTNYRVFDFDGGWGSSRASYFHKSLGGYHGAKLRNIQNVFEFHISKSNNKVLNMLNVKYFIQQGQMRPNPAALGSAWLGRQVKSYETANDEIRALGKRFELKNAGNGKLIVNGDELNDAAVYGEENLIYVADNGDSIPVNISNGIPMGVNFYFVQDVNGAVNYVPELTLENDSLNSFKKMVSIALVEDFNPRNDVVMLDTEAKKLSTTQFSGEGTINMTSYAPNEIVYAADSKEKQLAVFSEIYYKDGWKAYVDGKEQEILKVNYLLRGLELAPGKHTIEFKFDLPAYTTANTMAWVGSILILLLVAGGFVMDRRKQPQAEEATKQEVG